MKRLTANYDTSCVEHYLNAYSVFDGTLIKNMIDKLSAYEDVGLEPEDVRDLNNANSNIIKFVMDKKELDNKYHLLLEMYDKLQNESIELPCKVGDIFFINIQKKKTYECKISGFYISESEIQYMVAFQDEEDETWFETGETHRKEKLFKTREEAEKALEENNESEGIPRSVKNK